MAKSETKEVGKSLVLTIIRKLAFNAFVGVNVTEATLFRQVDRESSVLLLDEFENGNSGIKEAVTQILNSGFYREISQIPRNEKIKDGGYVTRLFSTFSPKVLSGISGVTDVLADRTIKVRTKKIKSNIELEEYNPTKEMERDLKRIVNSLYIFGLSYADKIYEMYNSKKINKIKEISARENDIWKPLLSIAKVIEEESELEISKDLIEYAMILNEEKRRINLENNISYKLIRTLDEFLEQGAVPITSKDGSKVGYSVQKVFEFIIISEEFENIKAPQQLSRVLRDNLDIKSERIYDKSSKRLRIYMFDKELIEDLKDRYNLKAEQQ